MNIYYEKEALSARSFLEAGECWHLYTPENHPVIFSSRELFKVGMNLMGICARLMPKVRIYTFQLMSNHIHIVVGGSKEDVIRFFELFRKLLSKYLKANNLMYDLAGFECQLRKIETLKDMKNVIAYDNRNGYLVSPDETPFSYPWGANRYYFNPDAKCRFNESDSKLGIRDIQKCTRSHIANGIRSLKTLDGYACPMDFCYIKEAESMFHNASQYFYWISKSIESNAAIAKEISENVFYTDDELYNILSRLSRERFGSNYLRGLPRESKIEMAKTMHYDYNAGNDRIARMLDIDISVVNALFRAKY